MTCLLPKLFSCDRKIHTSGWSLFDYLVVKVFPVIHCKNLKGHQQSPSNVIKAGEAMIGVGSSVGHTGVISWTRPEEIINIYCIEVYKDVLSCKLVRRDFMQREKRFN